MKIKTIRLAVILFNIILFTGMAYSQQDGKVKKTPEEFAQKKADKMKKHLTLSESQYKQVYDLFLKKAQDRKANREKYKSMDKTSRRELKEQNREKFHSQLKGILNKEQIEKWDQMKAKHKSKRGKGHHKEKNKNNSEDNKDNTKES